ncbi:hypothetical protein D3C86_1716720 [compost metagenome]
MSPVMMFLTPAAFAIWEAARTPAAGPDMTVCAAWSPTTDAAIIPPLACMIISSFLKPSAAKSSPTRRT